MPGTGPRAKHWHVEVSEHIDFALDKVLHLNTIPDSIHEVHDNQYSSGFYGYSPDHATLHIVISFVKRKRMSRLRKLFGDGITGSVVTVNNNGDLASRLVGVKELPALAL